MHKIDQKLKLFIFFLNFDLAKERGASAPLAPPWLRPCSQLLCMTFSIKKG